MSNCETRFAEAIEFAAFWQMGGGLVSGIDDSGLAAQSTISDSSKNFINLNIQVGYPVKNVTKSTYGSISAIDSATQLDTDLEWDDGDRYQIAPITSEMVAAIEEMLDTVAADLHVVMQSVGACNCTLSSAALVYLKKLNIVEAGVMYQGSCGDPNIGIEEKRMWLDWLNNEIDRILNGDIELCAGYTGASFPVVGYAQGNWTHWSELELIINNIKREGT